MDKTSCIPEQTLGLNHTWQRRQGIPCMLCKPSQNERKFWVRTDLKSHLLPTPLHGQTFHCPMLLQAPSSPSLNIYRNGAATASLDNLIQFCADLFLSDQEGDDMPKGWNFRGPASALGATWAMTGRESHTGCAAL